MSTTEVLPLPICLEEQDLFDTNNVRFAAFSFHTRSLHPNEPQPSVLLHLDSGTDEGPLQYCNQKAYANAVLHIQ